MAKRKLLEWMRGQLNDHVVKSVNPAGERKAMDAAYKKIAPLVTRMVQKKFKPVDMVILEKYGVAQRDECIKITMPDARVVEFSFRKEDEAPITPAGRCYNRMYLGDGALMAAYDAHERAKEAYDSETVKRRNAYYTLIRSASYVEDIIAVWPEAAALLPATAVMAPLTDEQMALIKADMSQREAA